jgi:hypothetical protein
VLAVAALLASAAVPATAHAAGYRSVSAGGGYACAIRVADDALVCWGANAFGQASPPAGRYAAVFAGGYHSCATRLLDRSAVCWGRNHAYYERFLPVGPVTSIAMGVFFMCSLSADGGLICGDKDPTCDVCDDGVPLSQVPPGGFEAVTAGFNHACAIRSGDGTLVCWGDDTFGEASPPPGAFASVSAGYEFTCGVRRDHALLCWGANAQDEWKPPPGSFTTVASGAVHACALRTDGSLACWGRDTAGETDPPPGSFKELSSGYGFSCAVRADGSLACWGANGSGAADPPGEPPKQPPTTTIALTPASPDGANGWYVSSVHAAVSATANVPGADVVQTLCALDPVPAPASFYDFPYGCAYFGDGLDVGGDGEHALYAASRDAGGMVEAPVHVRFKLDRAPPAVRCSASPALLWPRNGKLIAVAVDVSVEDATSGPGGFALLSVASDQADGATGGARHAADMQGWAVGTADAAGFLRAETRGRDARRYTLRYRGFDRAGNAGGCRVTVTVPANRGRA